MIMILDTIYRRAPRRSIKRMFFLASIKVRLRCMTQCGLVRDNINKSCALVKNGFNFKELRKKQMGNNRNSTVTLYSCGGTNRVCLPANRMEIIVPVQRNCWLGVTRRDAERYGKKRMSSD
jgi:hypothetical protein